MSSSEPDLRGLLVQNLAMERTGHASTRQDLLQTQERLARISQEADARQTIAEQARLSAVLCAMALGQIVAQLQARACSASR